MQSLIIYLCIVKERGYTSDNGTGADRLVQSNRTKNEIHRLKQEVEIMEAEKTKKAAELAETRRKKQLESDALVDDFSVDLGDEGVAAIDELLGAARA